MLHYPHNPTLSGSLIDTVLIILKALGCCILQKKVVGDGEGALFKA